MTDCNTYGTLCGVAVKHNYKLICIFRIFAAAVVVVGSNREDVSGQSTEQIMWHCVMLWFVLDSTVTWWHTVADWPSIGDFQAASSDRSCDNYRPVNSV